MHRCVAVRLSTTDTGGDTIGGKESVWTNRTQAAMLAFSTACADWSDPSPSLFKADTAGNSHSMRRRDGDRGARTAAATACAI